MGKKNDIYNAVLAAICEQTEPEVQGTDLAERGKFIVTTFHTDGSKYLCHEADTKDEARAWLQRPENLGKTITISKEIACLTTAIPLVNVDEEGA